MKLFNDKPIDSILHLSLFELQYEYLFELEAKWQY